MMDKTKVINCCMYENLGLPKESPKNKYFMIPNFKTIRTLHLHTRETWLHTHATGSLCLGSSLCFNTFHSLIKPSLSFPIFHEGPKCQRYIGFWSTMHTCVACFVQCRRVFHSIIFSIQNRSSNMSGECLRRDWFEKI